MRMFICTPAHIFPVDRIRSVIQYNDKVTVELDDNEELYIRPIDYKTKKTTVEEIFARLSINLGAIE